MDALSDVARHYIGGQLRHAMGLTGIAAPTVTSYKRLSPGTWAPVRAAWGVDNRTAMVRALIDGPDTRIENRLAGSCANPYLLAAAMVATGLDGVEHSIDPGDPAAHNVLEDERYPHVPTCLIDGLRAFEEDTILVEALGHDFTRAYLGVMKHVWKRFQSFVTDWEIKEYREVL
jgi:glutamine synthetase